jgi:HlyD family secretion protein
LKDLRETEAKIVEVRERIIPAADQLNRIEMRAPESGIVHQLNVHTKGGVIANGEIVMLIVPFKDQLIIEARVAPTDIDQVQKGSAVQVRITAGNQRTTPTLAGVVTTISADQTRDPPSGLQPGQPYFLTRVMLTEDSMRLLGDLRLVPGMQAEIFIETEPRTPLEYLIKPLMEQIARTFRER